MSVRTLNVLCVQDLSCRERLAVLWKVRGRLAMMTTVMALQGFSGHVAVNAYLQQIVGGRRRADAGPYAIGVDGLRVAATVVAGLTVERFGRKKLFVGGGLVQVQAVLIPGIFFWEGGIPPSPKKNPYNSSPQRLSKCVL